MALEDALSVGEVRHVPAIDKPRNLTLVYAAGQGDGKERGLNHLGHEGLVRRVIGGHWGLVPKLQRLAIANQIEAYNLPQGVISHLFRDIAAKRPGHLTRVGLGTFVDPRHGGGKINECTKEDLVQLIESRLARSFSSIAPSRSTSASSAARPPIPTATSPWKRRRSPSKRWRSPWRYATPAVWSSCRSNGIAERGSLNPRQVKIPGILVDCVVVAKPEHHWQTFSVQYDPAFSGEIRARTGSILPMDMNERKIIARRAALELKANSVVNLGIGMPEGVASVANEEKIADLMTLTAEPGVIGGVPAGGLNFGAATNAQTVIDQPYQFDFYDGGGLDAAFLGLAQADQQGNLNVSKFGPRLAGRRRLHQHQPECQEGGVRRHLHGRSPPRRDRGRPPAHRQDGNVKKFVREVEHRTFSGSYSVQRGQPVLYVTERCVFELTREGLELVEVAPGIDIERDILARMEFRPIIRRDPAIMDRRIFSNEPMGLRDDLLRIPLERRFTYHPQEDLFFVNFEGHVVRNHKDVERIRRIVEAIAVALGAQGLRHRQLRQFRDLPRRDR